MIKNKTGFITNIELKNEKEKKIFFVHIYVFVYGYTFGELTKQEKLSQKKFVHN